MRDGGIGASQQLCWNCANASKPWKCPWVGRGLPVKGWDATPTMIKLWRRTGAELTHSFDIRECPMFDEDSYGSGRTKVKRKPDLPRDRNYSDLIGAILAQSVEDWKAIDYGDLPSLSTSGGVIQRDELFKFFWSGWFEELLMNCTNYTPQQIRDKIRVPKRGYEPWAQHSRKSTQR